MAIELISLCEKIKRGEYSDYDIGEIWEEINKLRKPDKLTPERILELAKENGRHGVVDSQAFARAIEKEHGIGLPEDFEEHDGIDPDLANFLKEAIGSRITEKDIGKKECVRKFLTGFAYLLARAEKDGIQENAIMAIASVLGDLLAQGYGNHDAVEFVYRLFGYVMYGVDEEDGVEIVTLSASHSKH